MYTRSFFGTLLLFCLVSALALAEAPTPSPNAPPSSTAVPATSPNPPPVVSPTEPAPVIAADMTPEAVLSKIHAINQMEIHMGKMAKKDAKNHKVKRYAERLIKDHEKADRETQHTAKKLGVELAPAIPSAADTAQMAKLKTLRGSDFDEEYLRAMREGHDKAITFLTQAEEQVTDAHTKKLVGKVLPVIREHRNIAAKLETAR